MEIRRARLVAFACSFMVYLLPLVGPHAIWVFGPSLARELGGRGESREPLWLAADVSLAVALQAAAGALFHWFFRRPGWRRGLGLVASLPAFLIVLHTVYLVVIPARFLIEPDRASERAVWPGECSVPDAWLDQVRSPLGMVLERAGETILLSSDGSLRSLLRVPSCDRMPLDLGSQSPSNLFVTAGGRMIYQTMAPPAARVSWWYVGDPRTAPVQLEPPSDASNNDGPPVLSTDGEWVAWVLRDASAPRESARALLRRVAGPGATSSPTETVVSLAAVPPANLVLLEYDMQARTLTLVRGGNEVFEVGLDGAARRIVMDLGGVQYPNLRRTARGWVAWEIYKDSGSPRVAWTWDGRTVVHRVLKGRVINSVAADPDGRFIAVSVTGSLSIGKVQDAVYVLRAADGSEVFRKFLPPYARSQVAFLGRDFFAYTDYDGAKAEVRALRVPNG